MNAQQHGLDAFWVLIPYFNPRRYAVKKRLYAEFIAQLDNHSPPINYITVEIAFCNRPHEVTQAGNPRHLQLRSSSEIWLKENALNIAASRLPESAQYIAWIDADIIFARKDWAIETVQLLQHYDVIQMFSHAIDMGPQYETMKVHTGFMYNWIKHESTGKNYEAWHPGYAWACTRLAWNAMGGLMDWAILGSADRHMAMALIGRVDESMPSGVTTEYKMLAGIWQTRVIRIHVNLGYMPGTINHIFHGKKVDRRYGDRWQILVRNKYNPVTDIRRDLNGVFILDELAHKLRDEIKEYFMGRNEDSIDAT